MRRFPASVGLIAGDRAATIVTGPLSAETPPPAFPTLFPEIVSPVNVALPPVPFVASAPRPH